MLLVAHLFHFPRQVQQFIRRSKNWRPADWAKLQSNSSRVIAGDTLGNIVETVCCCIASKQHLPRISECTILTIIAWNDLSNRKLIYGKTSIYPFSIGRIAQDNNSEYWTFTYSGQVLLASETALVSRTFPRVSLPMTLGLLHWCCIQPVTAVTVLVVILSLCSF